MPYLLALTLLLSPAYEWHIPLFGLPANFLMLWIFLLWLIFAIFLFVRGQTSLFIFFIKKIDKKILWPVALFALSGLMSFVWAGASQKTLGQFLVIFVQPISLFFIAAFVWNQNSAAKKILPLAAYLFIAAAGAYAILQYFTGLGLPLLFQGNDVETRRAVSFFTHSNFYALSAAPLLAFLLADLIQNLKTKAAKLKFLKLIAWLIGFFGLILSMSRAGWLGLAAALIVYALIAADKKTRQTLWLTGLAAAICLVMVPSLRHRLTSPFYGEKSADSRITLWQSGLKGIYNSPIFGLGLTGYSREYRKLISDQTLPDHNFPHNIFLDLWVETGILGLISLAGLMGLLVYQGLIDRKNLFKLSVALFLIALVLQGQIDNPYFNNDLAAVFWLILSLA